MFVRMLLLTLALVTFLAFNYFYYVMLYTYTLSSKIHDFFVVF